MEQAPENALYYGENVAPDLKKLEVTGGTTKVLEGVVSISEGKKGKGVITWLVRNGFS